MPELLAELVAKITADATELKKALSESEKSIEGLGKTAEKETKSITQAFKEAGKSLTIVGGAITAAMTGAIISFTKTGSELHDLSLKTGVSVEALAGLKYAAEQNGASLGTIEMAIRRTYSAISELTEGSKETTATFNKLGLSLSDLQGLNPEQQFLKIATAIAGIPDPIERSAAASSMFGARMGTDMLPILSLGADGLRKMMEEGVKLTGWTNEGAKSADALGDAFGTLKTSTMGIANAIGESLVPAVQGWIEIASDAVKGIGDWSRENKQLTEGLGDFTLSLGVVLLALGSIGLALKGLAIAAGGLSLALMPLMLLAAGLGLVTFGITELIRVEEKQKAAVLDQIEYYQETQKWAKGEVNILWQLTEAKMATIEARIASGKATQEETAWMREQGEAMKEWIKSEKEAIITLKEKEAATKSATAAMWLMVKAQVAEINAERAARRGKPVGYPATQRGLDEAIAGGAFAEPGSWEKFQLWIGEAPYGKLNEAEYAAHLVALAAFTPQYQQGGIVENTGLAYLHQGEEVIPAGTEVGGITINFTQPVFFDREDTMNKFVDMIRKGIQRQDRLRFGGAYSGG